MSEISRSKLFTKLAPTPFKALESATVFCKLRGNPYVELVHWILQLTQVEKGDVALLVKHFELDIGRLQADFTKALDALPRGASSISDLSSHIDDMVERAWTYASIMFGAHKVRSAHLIIGALKATTLRNALSGISREFDKIKPDRLIDELDTILGDSIEAGEASSSLGGSGDVGTSSGAMGPGAADGSALKKYSVDLTEKARAGEIDPVLGRDDEIRQIIDILMRRRQNNPILTGEAGVGKTSVVEGFALRVIKGDVPPALRDIRLCSLDLGMLQAGASMKGEFENRLRAVIDEVQSSPKPTILFIDEAHTLIGAGGAAGTGDAANLLKPALARGKLRTVAATTFAEYKKYFEKDPALTRRFQVVQVDEPDEIKGVQMLRGMVPILQTHHKVEIQDSAVEAAVRLSHRYIPARQLPDKAVSLLDTACARVAVSQHATPAEVEDRQRRIDVLTTELEILEREGQLGANHAKRVGKLRTTIEDTNVELAALNTRWADEKVLVAKVLELRGKIDRAAPDAAQVGELADLQSKLSAMQRQNALVLPTVDDTAVAAVVQDWTGIPLGKMVGDEVKNILQLGETLAGRVIGQSHGLNMIAKRIQTARAKLDNPNKPVGVFMLCGPSGVGKTETALALADTLYGGEQNVITINMSEYQEAHTVSSLKGAPPGYVGYGEGGVLTEAVRRKPYSVVLLDEVEKAHPDVHEMFFQVFDKGSMEDGEGRYIDFKNTLILLTSNVGSELIMQMCADPDLIPAPEPIAVALREPLLKVFPAALLGRIVTIPYYPLSDAMLGQIIRLQLNRIVKRIRANHDAEFVYGDDVVTLVAARCTEVESGGRMIDAVLTNTILPRISEVILQRMMDQQKVTRVEIGVENSDFTYSIS